MYLIPPSHRTSRRPRRLSMADPASLVFHIRTRSAPSIPWWNRNVYPSFPPNASVSLPFPPLRYSYGHLCPCRAPAPFNTDSFLLSRDKALHGMLCPSTCRAQTQAPEKYARPIIVPLYFSQLRLCRTRRPPYHCSSVCPLPCPGTTVLTRDLFFSFPTVSLLAPTPFVVVPRGPVFPSPQPLAIMPYPCTSATTTTRTTTMTTTTTTTS